VHGIESFFEEHYGKVSDNDWDGKYEKENIRNTGFIAQELERAAIELGYDFSGVDKPKNDDDFYGLRYAKFVVPLVKADQELADRNDQLDDLVSGQQAIIEMQQNEIEMQLSLKSQQEVENANMRSELESI